MTKIVVDTNIVFSAFLNLDSKIARIIIMGSHYYKFYAPDFSQKAYSLCQDVDPDDFEFVSLALSLRAHLWTGDKKLIKGLRSKGFRTAVTTAELYENFLNR